MPEEGVFVDFFGKSACTTSTGLARVALHTWPAAVPDTPTGMSPFKIASLPNLLSN
jgi:lauroyl/myristoyl acyltransferase